MDSQLDLTASSSSELFVASRSEFQQVVQKYKAILDIPRNETDGTLNETEALARIEDLFDPDFVRHSEGDTDANLCDFKSELLQLGRYPSLHFKLFRYKQVAAGIMDYYLRFSTQDKQFVIKGLAYFRKARIYKTEVTRTAYDKVSGQKSATQETPLTRDRTERQFGCRIYELPSMVHGQLLGVGGNMLPVEEKYELLRIFLVYDNKQHPTDNDSGVRNSSGGGGGWNKMLNFWRDQYSLRLVDSKDQPYVKGASITFSRRACGSRRMILWNERKEPLALAYRHKKHGFWSICGTRPLIPGPHHYSEPKLEDVGESNVVAFYPWFRIKLVHTSAGRLYFGEVLTFDVEGTERDESSSAETMTATPAEEHASPTTQVTPSATTARVDFEPIYKVTETRDSQERIVTICDYYKSKDHLGIVKSSYNPHRRLTQLIHKEKEARRVQVDVAPGVDPALILCIASCLEMMEL